MELLTNDFFYNLPEERIALFPTDQRDESKLLVYNQGTIQHKNFKNIDQFIPAKSLLVFNNSKVIPARLKFQKRTGAIIEIFLLEPLDSLGYSEQHFNASSPVIWNCTIGNKKKWTEASTLELKKGEVILSAKVVDDKTLSVLFSWNNDLNWGDVIDLFGDTPLPPYIKRQTNETDKERYQTIYSSIPGAVAAPTAGLHFTSNVLKSLENKGVIIDYLTLHVGAGTFKPIKSEEIQGHSMHEERIIFSRENIMTLLNNHETIIPVGTTSCRSLESLYWFGVKLLDTRSLQITFHIHQNFPYQSNQVSPGRIEALKAVINYLDHNEIDQLQGSSSIFIYPGYTFRMTDGLITNFHQPGSTLILLIAALVGDDWRNIYQEALNEGYRFLSYGDSSFLIPK